MKKILCLALCLIMAVGVVPMVFGVSADGLTTGKCGKNVKYSFDSATGKLTISGKGAMTDYYIYKKDGTMSPFYANGVIKTVEIKKGVTSIGNEVFSFCGFLTSVKIPKTVTKIGNFAFQSCEKLTSIATGNGVTKIGERAFNFCENLKSVEIGKGLKSISVNAFDGCDSLKSIKVDSKNKKFSSKKGVLFNKKKTKLVCYPPKKAGKSYTIPKTVTTIGDFAFYKSKNLTSVKFLKKVKKIGRYAFSSCALLKSIKIPNSVTDIGDEAFWDCEALKSIKLGNSLTKIGANVFDNSAYFYNKSNWKNNVLYINNYLISATYRDDPKKYVDDYYIEWESAKGDYKVKAKTKVIADYAFNDCKELTSVTIPSSVKNIGSCVFFDCEELKSIKVDSKNKKFSSKKGVLFNKKKTKVICYPPKKAGKSYTIPKTVTTIGDFAFYRCRKLKTVKILNKVKKIGECAFAICDKLKTIKIGSGVTKIGKDAFNNTAYFLDKANWKKNVLYIGKYLITGSYHEKGNGTYYHNYERVAGNYSVKSGTKVIADYAFYDCADLQSVKVPKSVKNIGKKALGYYALDWYGIDKKVKNFTVKGKKGTAAQKYAKKNGLKFKKA